MPRLIMKHLGPLPPSGTTLPARLLSVEGIAEDLVLEHGSCVRFTFGLVPHEYQHRVATVLTSTALNEGSRLFALVASMLNRTVGAGEDITDTDRDYSSCVR